MRLIDLDQIEFLKVDGNKEFNHGVDCCVNRLLRAEPIEAVSIDRIKQAREEIENINPVCSTIGNKIPVLKNCDDIKTEVLEILDKLMELGED